VRGDCADRVLRHETDDSVDALVQVFCDHQHISIGFFSWITRTPVNQQVHHAEEGITDAQKEDFGGLVCTGAVSAHANQLFVFGRL
jgi:hypothetical protein